VKNVTRLVTTVWIVLVVAAWFPPAAGAGQTEQPSIKSICPFSHVRSDDPIVFPDQPGMSHSHDFFGNRSTDAFSDISTLDGAVTTCDFAEDRSAYWVPSLTVAGGVVQPDHLSTYYTVAGNDPSAVRPYPHGFRLITGDARATTAQPTRVTSWACAVDDESADSTPPTSTIPSCPTGTHLRLKIQFPECWDGHSLDSADHKSHAVYMPTVAGCPADHPVLVPSLGIFIHYDHRGGAGTSLSCGSQFCGHADFINAWDPTRLDELVTTCLIGGEACHNADVRANRTSTAEGDPLSFTVYILEPSYFPVTVSYRTLDGNARSPGDYTSTTGSVTIPAGSTSRRITVPTTEDTSPEGEETMVLELTDAENAIIPWSTARGTIRDDDARPAVSVADATGPEPTSGTKPLSCVLTLDRPSTQTIKVDWTAVGGTATAGSDFVAETGTATFTPGTTSKTVGVTVNADSNFTEGPEHLSIVLSNPSNATIADGTADLTITDPDTVPKLRIEGQSGPESGPARYSVTLTSPSSSPVSVRWATADRTATAPQDYPATTGTLTIPAGATAGTISVPVVNDSLSEGDERVAVELSGPTGALLLNDESSATIVDDDPLPSLRITDAQVVEPTSSTRALRFTITLSARSGQAVRLHWATEDGTAVAPGDYVPHSEDIVFTVGTTTKSLTVAAYGDGRVEGQEWFRILLSAVEGATVADGIGVGTIDDP
jgi:Domain of unknown function (DUF1996)/Calx-beta domain